MSQIKAGEFCPGCGMVCDGRHLDKGLRPVSTVRIRIVVGSGPETATLTCAHCKLPHRVTEEMRERYELQAAAFGVTVDQIWECGKCFLADLEHRTGQPQPQLRTGCDHEVPPPPFPGGA